MLESLDLEKRKELMCDIIPDILMSTFIPAIKDDDLGAMMTFLEKAGVSYGADSSTEEIRSEFLFAVVKYNNDILASIVLNMPEIVFNT